MRLALICLIAVTLADRVYGQVKVTLDPELPAYQAREQVKGLLTDAPTDSTWNLLALWTGGFQKHHPRWNSQTGRNARPMESMLSGRISLAVSSRSFTDEEAQAFATKFGYSATTVVIAYDAIGIFVHNSNPLASISLKQLDAIYSKTRKRGMPQPINVWGELGLEMEWKIRPIHIHGRNAASWHYGYFREMVLHGADFRDDVREQPGSLYVVNRMKDDIGGVGYGSFVFAQPRIRLLQVSDDKHQAIALTQENVTKEVYPLSRPIYLLLNHQPGSALVKHEAEFVRYILSKQGQEIAIRDGYMPIPAKQAREGLVKLGLKN